MNYEKEVQNLNRIYQNSKEKADAYFKQLGTSSGNIADDELENVSGGTEITGNESIKINNNNFDTSIKSSEEIEEKLNLARNFPRNSEQMPIKH